MASEARRGRKRSIGNREDEGTNGRDSRFRREPGEDSSNVETMAVGRTGVTDDAGSWRG